MLIKLCGTLTPTLVWDQVIVFIPLCTDVLFAFYKKMDGLNLMKLCTKMAEVHHKPNVDPGMGTVTYMRVREKLMVKTFLKTDCLNIQTYINCLNNILNEKLKITFNVCA